MNYEKFQSEMNRAETYQTIIEPERSQYWTGYIRGLRRGFHGEKFGTIDEHLLWSGQTGENLLDHDRRELTSGYRAGVRFTYCSQNGGDCSTCSLVSCSRDCQNNLI